MLTDGLICPGLFEKRAKPYMGIIIIEMEFNAEIKTFFSVKMIKTFTYEDAKVYSSADAGAIRHLYLYRK